MPLRPTRAAALLGALLVLGGPARAQEPPPPARALLIGVQDYPALAERLHLQAPAGDVRRLRAALVQAGLPPEDIAVMTEREGTRPTRAAVLTALAELARDARPGQQILVYFSGHGAQAPARRPADEPDGLEELYLAADAARWEGAEKRIPGAIADFELEAALAAIRARGAEVWFVADACHAAGLTRAGLAEDVRAKAVSAADLGEPIPRAAVRARASEPSALTGAGRGEFTGFYAASPGYLAIERPLPSGAADAAPASVFTFNLVRAISQGRLRTLRDLAISASAVADIGPGAPAPVFEGALGGPVLGLAPGPRTWRVRRAGPALTVEAGAFEGIDAGAELRLISWPDGRSLGEARVVSAGALDARIEVSGPLPDGPLAARLERPAAMTPAGPGERLLAGLRAPTPDGEASKLRVDARLWRGGCRANPPARAGFPPGAEPFDLMAPPPLAHCDVLYLRVVNDGSAPVDVSPLYLDASGAIADLGFAPRDDVRIAAGETRFAALRILTRDPLGRDLPHGLERLVLVVAAADGQRADLRTLVQPASLRGRGRTTGAWKR